MRIIAHYCSSFFIVQALSYNHLQILFCRAKIILEYPGVPVEPLNRLVDYLSGLIQGRLWLKVIIGLLLGVICGFLINPDTELLSYSTSTILANWLDLPGNIFLRVVQMVMIPLIFSSIITGIVSNDSDDLKRMGGGLFLYFIITTFISITLAIVLSVIMEPGRMIYESGGFGGGVAETVGAQTASKANLSEIPKLISDLIPSNPLETILSNEMLGVVIFTVIVGLALTQMRDEATTQIIRLIESIQKICMVIVSWAMKLVPFAVFGLMAALVSRVGLEGLMGIGYYISVVLLGLGLLMIVYMIILSLFSRVKISTFMSAARDPQLLAFSTASSAAVMPLSMEVADKKLGVSSKISDFVIPIGASINMDGTALFQCITALFMAQAYGIEMGLANLLLITVTLIGASIGTPAIPGGGVVILASVLGSAGIPTEGLIIVIGIDRILGMFRTAINVTGDLVACIVFDRLAKRTS